MVISLNTNSKETCERSDAKWKSLMEKQQEKLKPEREKVKASRLEAQAKYTMNESNNVALAKMKEEAKNLTRSNMDPLARAWYMMYRDHISKKVVAAQAAATVAAAATAPMMNQSTIEDPLMEKQPMTQSVLATQQPPVMEEPEVIEVAPLITH
jgi:hypothetical protein